MLGKQIILRVRKSAEVGLNYRVSSVMHAECTGSRKNLLLSTRELV